MYKERENISRQGEERKTHLTQACQCVTMRIMPVSVSTLTHASM